MTVSFGLAGYVWDICSDFGPKRVKRNAQLILNKCLFNTWVLGTEFSVVCLEQVFVVHVKYPFEIHLRRCGSGSHEPADPVTLLLNHCVEGPYLCESVPAQKARLSACALYDLHCVQGSIVC